jgi:AcrR family transcriptional regulator
MMDRRQALVDAAFRCIAERGLEGLRLRPVAADAGIDHSTLHHYFATKQELMSAVLEHVTRQFWVTMPAEGSAAEQLRHHFTALGELIRRQPELFVVLAELDLRGQRDPEVGQVIERVEAGWRESLTEVWRRGARQRAWAAPLAQDTAVELIISVVKGVRLLPDRAESVLRGLEQTLINGG